ncbi:MAG: flagellar assembly protein FliW [Alphaproteobacteria bacterium]|nr:flagellar assembly protein FliW [Alphaproteobacteria bacterium]
MKKHNTIPKIAAETNNTHGVIETKLGKIQYTNDDIFYFNDGLVGFPNKVRFTLTDVPGVPEGQRYGMLQSLDDNALSFIVHYPVLDEAQQNSILSTVHTMLGNEKISKDEIGFSFLVITGDKETGQSNVKFVTDAPLIFISKTQEAWQMVNVQ